MQSAQVEGTESCDTGDDVTFGKNARVVGRSVSIGSGTRIGDGVVIRSDVVKIGRRCVIEEDVEATWHGGNSEHFELGDCGFIGSDSRVLVKEFRAGDYVVLHNHLLANGDSELSLGHNSWMGQNGILNANSALKIGNNVGIGAYSAVWTHGKFGSIIDGCLMHKEAPVVIEDDACLWRAVVSPGVTVGRRVTVLPGAILTRDAPAGSCFGGVPAEDLSSKVKTYRDVTIEEQFQMMKEFCSEFLGKEYPAEHHCSGEGDYSVRPGKAEPFRVLARWRVGDDDVEGLGSAIVVAVEDATTGVRPGVSIFDLKGRTYTKWLTDHEVKFMWFLLDSRARFVPDGVR